MERKCQQVSFDVVVLGGGLAGLSLAIQLKHTRPETSIAVIEKRTWPVAEAAHKVGESTLQIGAHYFGEVCGMRAHLSSHQLPKLGLRFFLGEGSLEQRVEMGLATEADDAPTYQIDRGRFENALAAEADRLGVKLVCGQASLSVGRRGELHTVRYHCADGERELEARWIVDASGRAAILKRKLGLDVAVSHHCNAAWFRLGGRIRVDDWCNQPAWQARVPSGRRWLSTTHFMGPGYWFWVIPLASDATSFGLVADPDLVPFERMRRFEPLMAWLHEREPHVARELERHCGELMDFRVLKHYAHGAQQVFSPEGWCITGEAGVFLDPLYSPGSDMIAISNTMITRFVTASLQGKDVTVGVEFLNDIYLLICSRLLSIWDHQYPIFANPEATAAKVTWDFMTYFGSLALLVVTKYVAEAKFLVTVLRDIDRIGELNISMQRLFKAWGQNPAAVGLPGYACMTESTYRRLEADVAAAVQDPEWVCGRIERNTANIEAAAIEIMARVARREPSEIDPYSFTLSGAAAPDKESVWRPPAAMIRSLQEVSEPFLPLRDPAADAGLCWSTTDDRQATVCNTYSVWVAPRDGTPVAPTRRAGRGE